MKKKERRSVREGSIFSKKFPGDIDFIDKEFKQNPHKWRKTGFPNDFPVLLDPKIQRSYLKRFGEPFGDEIQYKLYWNEEEKKLAGGVYFSRRCEGPPNKVHGGAQATALDAAFGWYSVRAKGFGCVTLNLSLNYRKFIPLNSVVRIEVWCEKVEDQKLYMKGKLSNPVQLDIIDTPNYETAEVINSEATALFYQTLKKVMSFEQTYKLYGGRRGILLKDKILEQLIQDKEKLKHQTVETDETDHPKTAGFDSQMHLSKL